MLQYDPMYYPYDSRRTVAYGKRGMVATSQALAAQAGLDMLKKGGNAIDAAIATAACLTVVEPVSNGIGGDAFALVWTKGRLFGLNASGPAPRELRANRLTAAGHREMPQYGWAPVTVPGVPAAWASLSQRFGRLPLTEVVEPAAQYGEEGYPVSPTVAELWATAWEKYGQELQGEEFQPWFDTFAPAGRPPRSGELITLPQHAATIRKIAASGGEAFYRGELAVAMDQFSRKYGGFLRGEDLAGYEPEWVEPISVNYRGYDVWEIPPNGHGLVALLTMNILAGFDFSAGRTTENVHRQIEGLKLAFADGRRYIADPRSMGVTTAALLNREYAARRRELIGSRAILPAAGNPVSGGTVYLAAADGEGNMVSYIQSNYQGFGSGLVVPGTGISLHNRGRNFSLEDGHPNRLEPGKKPYHTIIPGFMTKNGQAVGPFGVMGGFMQPQGHVQVMVNALDYGLNPQAALDAPRWQWIGGRTVEVEAHFPGYLAEALARKGHDIKICLDRSGFGRGQMIVRDEHGILAGGCESRCDSGLAVW